MRREVEVAADSNRTLAQEREEAIARRENSRREAEAAAAALSQGAPGLPGRREVLVGMRTAQTMILDAVRADRADWAFQVEGLLSAYRRAAGSYAGGESPLYAALREAQESVRPLAYRDGILQKNFGDPVFKDLAAELDGRPLAFVLGPVARMLGQALWGGRIDAGGADVGLIRLNAARLLSAVLRDPGLDSGVKIGLIGQFLGSLLLRRGSWVDRELRGQFAGFFEDPSAVYVNPRTGRVSARFNGQVTEMDIQTLRYWELRRGTDFTLPFENRAVGGAKDLIANRRANFFLFSATIEDRARAKLEGTEENPVDKRVKVDVLGEVVKPAEFTDASVEMLHSQHEGRDALISAVRQATPADAFAVNRAELRKVPAIEKEIDAYLDAMGVPRDDAFVVNLNDPAARAFSGIARQWVKKRPKQQGLVSLFCSDTNAVMRRYRELVDSGTLQPDEIAVIYSDVQYEKANGDTAKVEKQMNLAGLDDGSVKVLIIDSDYVIRGIDLNFQGKRDDFQHGDFAGYNHVTVRLEGVERNTEMQLIQGVGRTAQRRVLPNTRREVVVTSLIETAKDEPVFVRMQEDPRFQQVAARVQSPAEIASARREAIAQASPILAVTRAELGAFPPTVRREIEAYASSGHPSQTPDRVVVDLDAVGALNEMARRYLRNYRDSHITVPSNMDWAAVDERVRSSGNDGLIREYNGIVKKYMQEQWSVVSARKLKASGFSDEAEAAPAERSSGIKAFASGGRTARR